MSIWTENYDKHPIHSAISEATSLLSAIAGIPEKDSTAIDAEARLGQIVDLLVRTLESVDSALVPLQTLNSLTTNLQSLNQVIKGYIENPASTTLVNANTLGDAILLALPINLIPIRDQDFEGIRESISNYKRSASQIVRRLEEESETVQTKLKEQNSRLQEFISEITSQKARLDTAIAEFQKQFSDTQSKRSIEHEGWLKNNETTFKNLEEKLRTSLTDLIDENKKSIQSFEQQLEKTIVESDAQLSALRKETEENFKRFYDDREKKLNTLLLDYEQSSDELIKSLEGKREEAARLVQIISNIGVTGNYSKVAEQNHRSADRYRIVAFVFMSAMVLMGLWTVWMGVHSFEWHLTLFRIFTTLIFAVPAYYAVRESERHRKFGEYNRKMELELASIDSYLEFLPQEKKEELKIKMAERFFGQPEAITETKKDAIIKLDANELLKSILNLSSKK